MITPNIKSALSILQCPLCQQGFSLGEGKSLVCPNRHTFDLAKQGYVNFVTRPVDNQYDKTMLTSRRLVIDFGFFNPLLDVIMPRLPSAGWVLDAGCGEGSQLAYLLNDSSSLWGVGIDLSKDGILLGARNHKNQIWAVADLSRTPFRSQSFSTILNILSPANYAEFKRLLTTQGKFIKVIPNANYLRELREFFYQGTQKAHYSNQDTVALFQQAFPQGTQTPVSYQLPITKEILPHIAAMTPLTWNLPREALDQLIIAQIPQITLDFIILES